jgi:hypothetical protein
VGQPVVPGSRPGADHPEQLPVPDRSAHPPRVRAPCSCITAEEVSAWERQLAASGYSRRTARDARSTLATVLGDAVPRHIQINPAQRRRGKGRKGQRRIQRIEQSGKAWPTPLQRS